MQHSSRRMKILFLSVLCRPSRQLRRRSFVAQFHSLSPAMVHPATTPLQLRRVQNVHCVLLQQASISTTSRVVSLMQGSLVNRRLCLSLGLLPHVSSHCLLSDLTKNHKLSLDPSCSPNAPRHFSTGFLQIRIGFVAMKIQCKDHG